MTPQKRTALRTKLTKRLELLRATKVRAARYAADVKVIQEEVLEVMSEIGLKTFSYEDDEGLNQKATRVQSESLKIDHDRLKKAIGAAQWNKVTTRVLDTGLLEDAIAEGRVDPVVVAECSETKVNKPYVKLTTKKGKPSEPDDETFQKPVKPKGPPRGRRRGTKT